MALLVMVVLLLRRAAVVFLFLCFHLSICLFVCTFVLLLFGAGFQVIEEVTPTGFFPFYLAWNAQFDILFFCHG